MLYTTAKEVNRNRTPPKGSQYEQTIINRITVGKTKLANSFGKYIGPFPHNVNCYNCNTPEDLHHVFNNCRKTKRERDQLRSKQQNIAFPLTYPAIILNNNTNILGTYRNIIDYIKRKKKIIRNDY
jgi:hypothetical protein